MEATVKSVSAFPNPQPFDVRKRIQELRSYLDPKNLNHQPEEQHTNIKAAIKLYEDGEINGFDLVTIIDGKLVPEDDILNGRAWEVLKRGTPRWREGSGHQYAQKHSYGHGPFGPSFHEVSISLF